jgi:flagellar basal body rod protein FlgC
MSGILSIAVSGLNAAAARIATAANNIVNASSTNYAPQDIVSISNSVGGVTTQTQPRAATTGAASGNGVDIAAELVTTVAATTDYGASAVIVKTAQKLNKSLLDIFT